jgi:hypothetical protein
VLITDNGYCQYGPFDGGGEWIEDFRDFVELRMVVEEIGKALSSSLFDKTRFSSAVQPLVAWMPTRPHFQNQEPGERLKQALVESVISTPTTMSQSRNQSQKPLVTPEKLKKQLEITNFDPNAILRGAQLTVVGG